MFMSELESSCRLNLQSGSCTKTDMHKAKSFFYKMAELDPSFLLLFTLSPIHIHTHSCRKAHSHTPLLS